MALDVVNTGNLDASSNIKVALPQATTVAGVDQFGQVGAVRFFSENDPGSVTPARGVR